jgi:hypothetical protein
VLINQYVIALPQIQNLVQMGNNAFHQHQSSTCSQQQQHKEPRKTKQESERLYMVGSKLSMLCQVTHLQLREHPYSLGNINESQFLRGGNNHGCSQWSYLMFQKCHISQKK